MVSRTKVAVSLGVVAVAAISLLAASWAGAQSKVSYPRNQTLITSGTQWGNIAGTNPYVGNYATGMVGLVNETLLRYDPLADKYINWLAKSAKFTGPKTYTIVIRSGIKWSNGQKFVANDVAFNIKLGRFTTAFWNVLYLNLKKISVKGNTVTIQFKGTPNYDQWQNLIWNLPMINPGQAKDAITNNASFTTYSPGNPIGTGPYQMDSKGFDPTTRVVWKKKAVWWAAQQHIAPSPAPKYIIDLCNTSNTNALSGLLTGIEDLNNNYLPGVEGLVASGKAQTYFPGAPYNLAANTAWLEVNTTKAPLSDPAFRKALAMSVNVDQIVTVDYHSLVSASNASGLLPMWKKWVNNSAVASKGVSYSTSGAIAALTAAGYTQKNGYFVNKDGSPIDLKIAVPQGWSDWEAARDMIVADAKDAHIKLHADVGDFNHWQGERNTGAFDTIIDNNYQLSDNPWTYFNGIFHLPIITGGTGQTFANFGRYDNAAAYAKVQQLDKTPLGNTAARKALMDSLQDTLLTDLPIIPMWYNGVWAQTQSAYWTNWPSSTSSRKYIPCMWRGYLQMTGLDMFTHVKKA
jgi:peptide/nickel transport system substrate-binding protein